MTPDRSTPPERLARWRDPTVLVAAAFACAAGFAQFGVTAALGDIAAAFGEAPPRNGVAAEVGMAATTLGFGLAVIRLASLASMPVSGTADRLGRRRVMLACCLLGLAITASASLTPSFWVFVAVMAFARPLLTATNAIAGVVAAEETAARHRSAAIALIGAAYSLGTGIISVLRGIAGDALGFRGVFALALVPLAIIALLAPRLRETPRFADAGSPATARRLGAVPRRFLGRLVLLCLLTGAVGLVFGPVFTYLFVYGERVLGASPGQMAWFVLAAGPAGVAGLLLGRAAADRLGRRVSAATAMVLLGIGGLIAYRAGLPALATGYLLTVFGGGAYTPSGGALDVELFPTSVRATAAGWLAASGVLGSVVGLAAFGVLADALGTFGQAALFTSTPAILLAGLYLTLPETRGMELEQSAPEES